MTATTQGIPMVTLPFPKQPKYGAAERAAVLQLLESGHLSETTRGPATTELENDFATFVGTAWALSFNSGTASLTAALHAVGARPDAGVLMSPMTWISSITAAFHAGSYPVFADVQADSVNLDPACLAGSDDVSAALVTHAWGVPAAMKALTAASNVPVVEDCSHAHGAQHAGRLVGSWGAAGCFSLQEAKAVSGGEGGILTTSNRAVYERAMSLGHHPHRLQAELTLPELATTADTGAAHKYRMPALSAVIAREQLRGLPARMATAEANLATLREVLRELGAPVAVPDPGPGGVRGWYGTPLQLLQPDVDAETLHDTCTAQGIPARRIYPDWLASPLLHTPDLLHRFWPHLIHSGWRPPDPEAFPHYRQARRRTLVLKIPTVAAGDYMTQVGQALAAVLTRLPARTRSGGS